MLGNYPRSQSIELRDFTALTSIRISLARLGITLPDDFLLIKPPAAARQASKNRRSRGTGSCQINGNTRQGVKASSDLPIKTFTITQTRNVRLSPQRRAGDYLCSIPEIQSTQQHRRMIGRRPRPTARLHANGDLRYL